MLLYSALRRSCRRAVIVRLSYFVGPQLPQKAVQPFFSSKAIITSFLSHSSNSRLYSTDGKGPTSREESKPDDSVPPPKKLTTKERLKIITTQYGAFGMAFHITISLASLGMFYFLVYSGFDFAPAMAYLGMESSKFAAGASTIVIAYAVHKVFAPVRIGITFVSVPILVKHFRKIGFFKIK